MCGRYSLFMERAGLEARFGVEFPDHQPRYNCAPGQELPVITPDSGQTTRMSWGFTPSWADERFDLINARSETVTEKRSFADAFSRRRCLVPADGFYEWTDTESGSQPYRVALEDDRPFAMAGIHEQWIPETTQTGLGAFTGDSGDANDDAAIDTYAVLTTDPNEPVEQLHHRMAVILEPEDEETWLHGSDEEALELLAPRPGDDMKTYPISTRVNSPANDEPSLIDPIES
ncbi:MAG: hypothetical protein A07HR60_02171 [uncultured archaeon A07HR60]|nr:MAG: hypothetical protein A07HR60_02171 [uncultured archaeon A07HR60]